MIRDDPQSVVLGESCNCRSTRRKCAAGSRAKRDSQADKGASDTKAGVEGQ